jgi:hypothetical protein
VRRTNIGKWDFKVVPGARDLIPRTNIAKEVPLRPNTFLFPDFLLRFHSVARLLRNVVIENIGGFFFRYQSDVLIRWKVFHPSGYITAVVQIKLNHQSRVSFAANISSPWKFTNPRCMAALIDTAQVFRSRLK